MGALDSASTLLTSAANGLRSIYHPDVYDAHGRYGGAINRLLKFSTRKIEGDGITIQVVDKQSAPGRFSRSINGGFHRPKGIGVSKYTVTLSETDSSNNFSRLAASVQTTHLDLNRARKTKASAIDFVKRIRDGALSHIGETAAVHRHLDATAKVATISTATPKKNDRKLFSDCAALSTTGGARVQIINGSLAALPRGLQLSVYSSAGTYRFDVEVTDYNPRDRSVGFYGLDADGNPSSAIDLTGIAASDTLYISGEKDKGLISIGEWCKTPTAATGDSFFGKNREDPDFRWMQPHISGPTTARAFAPSDIDEMAIEAGYLEEDPEGGFVALTTPEGTQTYKNAIGNDILIQYPTNAQKGEIIAAYGFDGNMYRHELLGRIMLQADPLAPPDEIKFLRPGDWETLSASSGGDNSMVPWEWLPGDVGEFWYRMNADNVEEGRSTVYRADGMGLFCDICIAPWRQMVRRNCTFTAKPSAAA